MDATRSMPIGIETRFKRTGWRSARVALAALGAALVLSACGGGDDGCCGAFNVGVSVDGQVVSQGQLASGGTVNVSIFADQSVVADAGEPVVWTLYAGGRPFPAGSAISYGGVDILTTVLSASSVAVDTRADFSFPDPVQITMVATSTYDSAEIGVDIQIWD